MRSRLAEIRFERTTRADGLLIGLCVFALSLLAASAADQAPSAVPEQSGPYQAGGQTNQAQGQHRARRDQDRPAASSTGGLDLGQGYLDFDTPDFKLRLVKTSQTVAALQPKGAGGFDFTPADRLGSRLGNDYYHLGDLRFRLRKSGQTDWTSYSTAEARQPVVALAVGRGTLAAAGLTPTLPADCPLQAARAWKLDHGRLVLEFTLKNTSPDPVEIGALGIPMCFNNIITGRSLEEAHATCSFSDPAIGLEGGYIQVTRLNGQGPALVVVPEGKTSFEAYNPLLAERTRREQTFEGFYEWLVHSSAYATNEWKNAQPWNAPSSETLATGKTKTFGVKFLVAPEIRAIEKVLADNGRPVAVGLPGYVLPMDTDARLFLKYSKAVDSAAVEPDGAISIEKNGPTKHGWQAYNLRGKQWGRARLKLTYADGLVQTIHYDVIKPEQQAVADLGHFLFTKQWFEDPNDPFHRGPSVMTYDRAHDKTVTQDARVWLAGLEDEGGAGSWVAAAMKEYGQPQKDEVEKFEQFVDGVLWGGIQYQTGPCQYGVRKSLFYYDTSAFPNYYDPKIRYGGWTSWDRPGAERIDRAYNYPHVVAAYWSMYRLARNYTGLVSHHPWDWYLDHAYQTVKFLTGRAANGNYNVGYINTGLMEGDIFVMLLKDLRREGWNEKAAELETAMKTRAERWSQEAFPFGSEMAWDSTGQEEVYAWTEFFGYDEKGQVSLDSILGYMPTVPHWGYNGNARRYWDFLYGAAPGPTSRIERQIHHYGSGINAIPVLASYRAHPEDFYLLRVGYGGTMGAITGIDQDGFASAAFHAWPSTLRWDAYSGDYGPNFFGHAVNTATYVINHPEFGWQALGGGVEPCADKVKIQPLDSFRQRLYVAPSGLWLTLDAGTFDELEVGTKARTMRVGLSSATEYAPFARLRIEQPARLAGVGDFHPVEKLAMEREAFVVPLKKDGTTWVELSEAP